jgi:hypothetical protein
MVPLSSVLSTERASLVNMESRLQSREIENWEQSQLKDTSVFAA